MPDLYREVLLHQVEVAEAHEQPGGECQQRNHQDERNKEPAQAVGQLLNGRLSREPSHRSEVVGDQVT